MFACLPQLGWSSVCADTEASSHYYANHVNRPILQYNSNSYLQEYRHFKYNQHGLGLLSRFLIESHQYLKEDGCIYITLSSRLDSSVIDRFIVDHGFTSTRLIHYPAIQDVRISENSELKPIRYEVIGLELRPLPFAKYMEPLCRLSLDYTPSSLCSDLFQKCYLLQQGASVDQRLVVVQPGDWPKVERALKLSERMPQCKITRVESKIFKGVALDVVELPPAFLVSTQAVDFAVEATISRSSYLTQIILSNELLFTVPSTVPASYFESEAANIVDLGFGANQLHLEPEHQLLLATWHKPISNNTQVQPLLKDFCVKSFGFSPPFLNWSTSGGTVELFNNIFQHLISTKVLLINIRAFFLKLFS